MTKTPLLHTQNLEVGHQNKTIISGLNLQLQTGKMTCLLGQNGAGKSTLLHTLTGMIPALSGEVSILEKSIKNQTPQQQAKLIAVVLSQKLTPINLTVLDVVSLGRTPHTNWLGHLSKKDLSKVNEALELVHLNDLAHRSINELSDGEKQRVMIAKALAQDTPLLILDEPTAHLDVSNRVALLTLLKSLAKETQKSILLSTHELEMAIQLADTIWLIDTQRKMNIGAPEDLVLNGKISQLFDSKHVFFNPEKGNFQLRYKNLKPIILQGEGLHYFWTKQALEKEGFHIQNENNEFNLKITLNSNELYSGQLFSGDSIQSFYSIGELKNLLLNDT